MELNSFETGGLITRDLDKKRKFFRLAEANAALPLVKRIVQDIVDQYAEAVHISSHLHEHFEDLSSTEVSELECRRQSMTTRLNDLVSELAAIGCELKDWESGLVDFPALLDGHEVCLCWRLGESRIEHWHEVHAGFLGRTAIDDPELFTYSQSPSAAPEPARMQIRPSD